MISDKPVAIEYIVMDSTQMLYPFVWDMLQMSRVSLFIEDVEKTLGVDFHLIDVLPTGGRVELLTPPVAGEKLLIVRNTPSSQSLTYKAGSSIDVVGLETQLDHIVMTVQEENALSKRYVTLVDGDISRLELKVENNKTNIDMNRMAIASNDTDLTALSARTVALETFHTTTLVPYMTDTTNALDALTTSTHSKFLAVDNEISNINGVNAVQANDIASNTVKAESAVASVNLLEPQVQTNKADLLSVNNDQDAIIVDVADHNTRLIALESGGGGVTPPLQPIYDELNDHDIRITANRSDIVLTANQLAAVKVDVARHETTLNTYPLAVMDAQVTANKNAISTTNVKVNANASKLVTHDASLVAIDGKANANKLAIEASELKITANENDISTNSSSIGTNANAISGINSDLVGQISSTFLPANFMNLNDMPIGDKTYYQDDPSKGSVTFNYPQGVAFVGRIYYDMLATNFSHSYQVLDGVDSSTDSPYHAVRVVNSGVWGSWKELTGGGGGGGGNVTLSNVQRFWVTATGINDGDYPPAYYPYWYVCREEYSDGYVKLALTSKPGVWSGRNRRGVWVTYSQLQIAPNAGGFDGTIVNISSNVVVGRERAVWQSVAWLDQLTQKVYFGAGGDGTQEASGYYHTVFIEYMPDLVYPPTNPVPRP